MYKVFVNDKPIILTNSLEKDNNFPVYIFKNAVLDEIRVSPNVWYLRKVRNKKSI